MQNPTQPSDIVAANKKCHTNAVAGRIHNGGQTWYKADDPTEQNNSKKTSIIS
jgi:hypothetical protein